MVGRLKVGIGLALMLAAAAADAAVAADSSTVIPDVPRFKLFASSHSTAAAEVMACHGVKTELPEVALIGGLEGRIYRCECPQDIHLWDVAAGTRLWARAQGVKVKTEVRVLRAGDEKNALDFAHYRQAIDAGRPVILTYSLDPESEDGMVASYRSQERVSVVGIGYEESKEGQHLIALLPEGAEGEERFEHLAVLSEARPYGDKGGLLRIPWCLEWGNLIATFLEIAD